MFDTPHAPQLIPAVICGLINNFVMSMCDHGQNFRIWPNHSFKYLLGSRDRTGSQQNGNPLHAHIDVYFHSYLTRTTWTPAFWNTPVIHFRSQVERWQSQSYKFLKKIAKNLNFEILHLTLHATHLLKLLNKMYKYEMDPIRTVGAAEWPRDAGWMDGRMDGQTDGWIETNIPPNNFVELGV